MPKPKFTTRSSVKLGPMRWTTTGSNRGVSVATSTKAGRVSHQTRSTAGKGGVGFTSDTKLK